MRIVKVAIIGCGGIANGKHMPSLTKLEHVELVAFCDIIRERAEKAAEKYGVKGAKVYEDYTQLLKDPAIEVVHVCTPNSSHAPITIAALESGKHVMCEKPMAINSEQARAMVETSERTGMKLTIGYQSRYRADSEYLKKLCVDGELGEIYYAKALAVRRRGVPTWGVFLDEEKQGGGPLIDIGTHALDLTLYMMDNYEPEMVVGSVYHKLSARENAANDFGPWDPKKFTVEDSAFGFIKFKNGATVQLESSWALNTLDTSEAVTLLCGTEGGADFKDGLRINGEKNSRLYIMKPNLEKGGVAFYEGASTDPSAVEARMWIDHVMDSSKELRVKPRQALMVTVLLEAIYNSSKSGKPICFD